VTTPPPVHCYRCGQPGQTRWITVTTLGNPEPRYHQGEQYCLTDGCTDLDGSRRLVALSPEELWDRADRAWRKRHQALVEDR
jgi:hypothetical protein